MKEKEQMDTPTRIKELWMNTWIALMMDGEVTVQGNGQSPSSVIATLQEVVDIIGMELEQPSYGEVKIYLEDCGRFDEIQYLSEEF